MTLADHIGVGIPPDPDQRILNRCAYVGYEMDPPDRSLTHPTRCSIGDSQKPLVVVAAGGRLTVLCPFHYRLLGGGW